MEDRVRLHESGTTERYEAFWRIQEGDRFYVLRITAIMARGQSHATLCLWNMTVWVDGYGWCDLLHRRNSIDVGWDADHGQPEDSDSVDGEVQSLLGYAQMVLLGFEYKES